MSEWGQGDFDAAEENHYEHFSEQEDQEPIGEESTFPLPYRKYKERMLTLNAKVEAGELNAVEVIEELENLRLSTVKNA